MLVSVPTHSLDAKVGLDPLPEPAALRGTPTFAGDRLRLGLVHDVSLLKAYHHSLRQNRLLGSKSVLGGSLHASGNTSGETVRVLRFGSETLLAPGRDPAWQSLADQSK